MRTQMWLLTMHSRHLRKCREKAALIVRVEELVGWRRLWDELLVYIVQESAPGGVTGTLEAHEPPWKRKQALYFT